MAGHPHTEALHITERFPRRDFGHMDIAETIDDPGAFNNPFTITLKAEIVPDTEILEYVCAENEKDHRHLVGTILDPKPAEVTVTPQVLSKYVGAYEFAFPENPTVMTTYNVTMSDGKLFLDTEGKGKGALTPVIAEGTCRKTAVNHDGHGDGGRLATLLQLSPRVPWTIGLAV